MGETDSFINSLVNILLYPHETQGGVWGGGGSGRGRGGGIKESFLLSLAHLLVKVGICVIKEEITC